MAWSPMPVSIEGAAYLLYQGGSSLLPHPIIQVQHLLNQGAWEEGSMSYEHCRISMLRGLTRIACLSGSPFSGSSGGVLAATCKHEIYSTALSPPTNKATA